MSVVIFVLDMIGWLFVVGRPWEIAVARRAIGLALNSQTIGQPPKPTSS